MTKMTEPFMLPLQTQKEALEALRMFGALREWDAYQTKLIQYLKGQLARQNVRIAALEKKVKHLQK